MGMDKNELKNLLNSVRTNLVLDNKKSELDNIQNLNDDLRLAKGTRRSDNQLSLLDDAINTLDQNSDGEIDEYTKKVFEKSLRNILESNTTEPAKKELIEKLISSKTDDNVPGNYNLQAKGA